MIDLDEKITVTRRQLAAIASYGVILEFAREDAFDLMPRFLAHLPTHPWLRSDHPQADAMHAVIDQVLRASDMK